MKALVIIVAVLMSTVPVKSWTVDGVYRRVYSFMWPPKSVVPLPPERPVAPPPEVVRSPEHKPPANTAKKPNPNRKPVKKASPAPKNTDEGPDLPYPCFLVRAYSAGKTPDELNHLGAVNGITPKQRRQARACLAAK